MRYWADILEAAKTPLGIIALAMMIVGSLAYLLFRRDSPSYRAFAFLSTIAGLGLALGVMIYVGSDKPNPPIPPQPKDACDGVDITYDPNNAIGHTLWCGSGGATRTTQQQALFNPNPSCKAYAQRDFAALTQNELFVQARALAKENKGDQALELIDACQCHNPADQALIKEARQKVLCYLKRT